MIPNKLPNADYEIYIGTYTSKDGSHGIYRSAFNPQTAVIGLPQLAVTAENPSFLTADASGTHLFAVHELEAGSLSSFTRLPSGDLHSITNQSAKGSGTCFVSLSRDGLSAYVANYSSGSFAKLPIAYNGALEPSTWSFQNSGHGPDQGRQSGPHAHSIIEEPGGKFAAGCDLGTDEVLVFQGANLIQRVKTKPGSGPRHLAFSLDGHFAYVGGELLSTIQVFRIDAPDHWASVQIVDTVPSGWHHGSYIAEVSIHPNGKWLYVSNRGHDSITAYRILPTGFLELIENRKVIEQFPRGFTIDPTGHWLIVAGQNSNNLEALWIDPQSGKLTSKHAPTPTPSPVSILVLPKLL